MPTATAPGLSYYPKAIKRDRKKEIIYQGNEL